MSVWGDPMLCVHNIVVCLSNWSCAKNRDISPRLPYAPTQCGDCATQVA